MNPTFKITLSLMLGLGLAPLSQADLNLFSKPCLEGKKTDRWVQARAIVAAMRGASDWSSVEAIQKGATVPIDQITKKLGDYADSRCCEFGDRARFENDYELVKAVAIHFKKKEKEATAPDWLKPGFKAVLSTFDSNNSLFIEMTENGFVFHDCEVDDGNHTGDAPHPSEKCPTMFNSAVFVPANQMLADSVGVKHAVLMSLKIVAEVGVVALSAFDAGFATSGANLVNTLFGPQPVGEAHQLYAGERAVSDLIKMGKLAKEGTVVTRILPFTWTDLKASVTQMVQDIFKADYRELNKIDRSPKNPRNNGKHYPGLLMQQNFHKYVNETYKADEAASSSSTSSEGSSSSAAPSSH